LINKFTSENNNLNDLGEQKMPISNCSTLNKVKSTDCFSVKKTNKNDCFFVEEVAEKYSRIVTFSKKKIEFFKKLQLMATLGRNVCIYGEMGTGKQSAAELFHTFTQRKGGFVTADMALFRGDTGMTEKKLFGHMPNAYTNSGNTSKKGVIETANKGVCHVDELHLIPSETQSMMLRCLQESEIIRIGATKYINVDVQYCFTFNQWIPSLDQVAPDFLYRIWNNVLVLPPLREMKEDIQHLIYHFIRKSDSPKDYIQKKAVFFLQELDWPGNIRELETIINMAVFYSKYHHSEVISLSHVQDAINYLKTKPETIEEYKSSQLNMESKISKKMVEELLQKHKGNVELAVDSKEWKRSKRSFYSAMKKYNIENKWKK